MREKNYNAGLRGVLFEAKHYRQMGQAVWLYGWLVLRETRERDGVGFVLGGKPVSYREIEEETGFARKSLERWMRTLRASGYVETIAAPGGVIVRIQKAKKFVRQSAEMDSAQFPQAPRKSVEKLWKSPGAGPLGVPNSAESHRRCEEGAPQICAKAFGKYQRNAVVPQRIGSRCVEREIEILRDTLSPIRSSSVEKASPANSCEEFFPLEERRTALRVRTAGRDDEIEHKLRIGTGPEPIK